MYKPNKRTLAAIAAIAAVSAPSTASARFELENYSPPSAPVVVAPAVAASVDAPRGTERECLVGGVPVG